MKRKKITPEAHYYKAVHRPSYSRNLEVESLIYYLNNFDSDWVLDFSSGFNFKKALLLKIRSFPRPFQYQVDGKFLMKRFQVGIISHVSHRAADTTIIPRRY